MSILVLFGSNVWLLQKVGALNHSCTQALTFFNKGTQPSFFTHSKVSLLYYYTLLYMYIYQKITLLHNILF